MRNVAFLVIGDFRIFAITVAIVALPFKSSDTIWSPDFNFAVYDSFLNSELFWFVPLNKNCSVLTVVYSLYVPS
jgi:hypothetical protein